MKPDLIIRLEYDLLHNRENRDGKYDYQKINCPHCNFVTHGINGITKHMVVNPTHTGLIETKLKLISRILNFQEYCHCGKSIKFDNGDVYRKKHTHFCSSNCYMSAKKTVHKYYKNIKLQRKCTICNKKYVANHKTQKVCSNECYRKLLSINSKKM